MEFYEFKEKFGLRLTPQQEEAVVGGGAARLILAVPGSGKTTVLIARLGYMLYCLDIPPESILTMTYTVAAARDMRERFRAVFGEEYAPRLAFRTINGVCARVIGLYSRLRGSEPFKLLENTSGLLSEVCRAVRQTFPSEGELKDIQAQITYAKNRMLTAEEAALLKAGGDPLGPLYEAYNAELRRRGLMDYDDQMVYALTILRRYPELLARLRARWRHLLVDEAQDTSKIQHAIIELLASAGTIFMVGDEDQSIYGFRAAYPEALMGFEETYQGARLFLLEENFRSTGEIVSAADRFIKRNALRREKRMVTRNPVGAPLRELPLKSRGAQYDELSKILRSGGENAAVLFRNNDSALPLIDLFSRLGIPYRSRAIDSGFFTHPIVRDVLDFMRLAADPFNGELFLRLYYKMDLRISREEAQSVARYARREDGSSFFHQLALRPGVSERKAEKLLMTHSQLMTLRTDTPALAVSRIRYELGYGAYLLQRGSDGEKLNILRALAFQEPDLKGLIRRFQELSLLIGEGGGESGPVFSTIHSAKGLEFDRVFLIDAIDGLLPCIEHPEALYLAPDDARTLEEERRLFYVAVTRARHELTLLTYKGLPHTFIRQLLSREVPLKTPPVRRTVPAAPRSAAPEWTAADIPVGGTVRHKAFGTCLVLEKDGDLLKLRLPDGAEKTLLLSACLANGLLEPIQ